MNRIASKIVTVYVTGLDNYPQSINADYPWNNSQKSYNNNPPYNYEAKRNIEHIKVQYEQSQREELELQNEGLMTQIQKYQYQLDNEALSSAARKIERKLNQVKEDLKKLVHEYQQLNLSYINENIY